MCVGKDRNGGLAIKRASIRLLESRPLNSIQRRYARSFKEEGIIAGTGVKIESADDPADLATRERRDLNLLTELMRLFRPAGSFFRRGEWPFRHLPGKMLF